MIEKVLGGIHYTIKPYATGYEFGGSPIFWVGILFDA